YQHFSPHTIRFLPHGHGSLNSFPGSQAKKTSITSQTVQKPYSQAAIRPFWFRNLPGYVVK
ncbi:MAG: hypothetical protein ACK55I_41755, partial [bacterium]